MGKKRKDGYLRTSFTLNGKRYYVYGKNRAELAQKEQEKRNEIEQVYINNCNPTLLYYYENWKERKRNTVIESTLRGYEIKMITLQRYIIPKLSMSLPDMLVKKISINEIIQVQQMLISDGKHSNTVNGTIKFVKRLLEDCRKERIIEYNPCDLWVPIKRTEEQVRNTSHRALSKEEQKYFFEHKLTKINAYYNVYRMALLTGMRVGEIVSLKYSDIKGGLIYVQRTMTKTEKGAYIVGKDTKTKSSRRTIPVTDQIKKVIQDQKQNNIALGFPPTSIDDYIFLNTYGRITQPCNVWCSLRKLCRNIGMEDFSMHSFRATFATRCIENGMQMKTLQEILGHKNFNLTMSLYGHVLEDTKTEEMNKIKFVI